MSSDVDKILVEIGRLKSDSNAYSLFALATKRMREGEQREELRPGDVGTASILAARSITFFKGTTFARVTNETKNNSEPAIALARLLAATFDRGEDDIPVLVKHLPDWQTAQRNAVYAVNIRALRDEISSQPILNELTLDGRTAAVATHYGQSQ